MVFKKIIFQKSLMANETPSRPPPLHGKCHLKFPFWFSAYLPYSLFSFWAFWVYFVICVCLESEDLVHNSLLIWSKLRNFFPQLAFPPTPTVRWISLICLICYMDLSVTILCRSDSSCKTFCRHLLAFPPTTTLQLHKSCSVCTILKTHNLFRKWTPEFDILP